MASTDTTREPIAVLSDEVAARIAAGEVIERPASVVKELVENALDAGAGRIEVLIEGGGLDRIRVADDGCGVPSAEVELAFVRHGTSKLRTDADLERIATLGFRGEALPSIAAVSDVLFETRSREETAGAVYRLRGGRIVERSIRGRQAGTTVTVDDLFLELPARRRFLRSRSSEGGACVQAVSHLALARPDVAFKLVADGRTVLTTPGSGDLREAATSVRGASFGRGARELGPLEIRDSQGAWVATIHGLLGPTQEQRSSRAGLSIFVNGRWVQNRALSRAVEEAYRTHLRIGRYPVAIVMVDLPPRQVDVNVHPAKSEVRLIGEGELYGRLHQAVLEVLPMGQHTLFDEDDEGQHPLPFEGEGLRIVGQVGGTYIVAEGALGLYLIDQHAAHERVLLEALRDSLGTGTSSQALLSAEVLEIPDSLAYEPEIVSDVLRTLGFEADPFGTASVLIRAVPAVLVERRALGALSEALDALVEERGGTDWRERLAVELACKTAIRAGDTLGVEEAAELVRSLGEARLHEHCAHGRPTSLLLSHSQLARQFGRS